MELQGIDEKVVEKVGEEGYFTRDKPAQKKGEEEFFSKGEKPEVSCCCIRQSQNHESSKWLTLW